MRKLNPKKPLVRETSVDYGGRPLIVRLFPDHLEIREKHRRKKNAVRIEYEVAFKTGMGLQFLVPEEPARAPIRPRKTKRDDTFLGKFDLERYE